MPGQEYVVLYYLSLVFLVLSGNFGFWGLIGMFTTKSKNEWDRAQGYLLASITFSGLYLALQQFILSNTGK